MFGFNWGDHMNCVVQADAENKGGLWIGNIGAAQDKHQLEKHNIKAILTAADGTGLKYTNEYKHMVIPAEDYPGYDLQQHF